MRRSGIIAASSILLLAAAAPRPALAEEPADQLLYPEALGIGMESWPYPHAVHFLPVENEGQALRMAYMDVAPTGPANGRNILLLHGKNFSGFYWAEPIRMLAAAGFRVVVPDQIGFGKSSKPDLHYSFDLLAANTIALADALKLDQFDLLGHSTGGMLAVRIARTYPQRVAHLVLEDPIGLEDYRRLVPPQPTETLVRAELAQTQAGYRKFVQGYFVTWRPDYEKLVEPYARMMLSGEYPRYAKASALTYQMIYQQPVVYDLPLLTVPTLLIVGLEDHSALGKPYVSPEVRQRLGDYTKLGKEAAAAIPGARLVEIENVGHIPHLEAPERFEQAVLEFLGVERK